MTSQTPGNPDEELTRARAAARVMSERQLRELLREGSSAFAQGAWQVLDEEMGRRRKEMHRHGAASFGDEEERYPALRIIVFFLKAIAVLALVAAVVGAALLMLQTREAVLARPLTALLFLVAGGWVAITYWASAELLVLLMDVERNTRSMRSD
jgi:hypothetical protein